MGRIQFTTVSGASVTAPTSLAVNGQVYMVADVTNDDQLLGVSWSVTCGSSAAPGGISIDRACGTFNPAEESGPVPLYLTTGIITTFNAPAAIPTGKTVTLTAHATALPSVTSSVTLTIVSAGTHLAGPEMNKTSVARDKWDSGNIMQASGVSNRVQIPDLHSLKLLKTGAVQELKRKTMKSFNTIGLGGEHHLLAATGRDPGATGVSLWPTDILAFLTRRLSLGRGETAHQFAGALFAVSSFWTSRVLYPSNRNLEPFPLQTPAELCRGS